jgi:hypothetical protein
VRRVMSLTRAGCLGVAEKCALLPEHALKVLHIDVVGREPSRRGDRCGSAGGLAHGEARPGHPCGRLPVVRHGCAADCRPPPAVDPFGNIIP